MSDPLDLITYCGLYCGLCSNRNRIPQHARKLKETLIREGYEHFGPEIPMFREFWQFLNLLEQNDAQEKGCSCRTNGGPPFCGIRKCAKRKNVQICSECIEYPCHRIHGLAKGYPTMLADTWPISLKMTG